MSKKPMPSIPTRHHSLLCLSLCWLLTPTGWADALPETAGDTRQEAPPQPAAPAAKLEAVTVNAGRTSNTEERRQSTASRLVFGRDELDRYGDSNLADVLKRLPGVTLGGRPNRGGEIHMRGLGNGYTQILLNGEPAPRGFSLGSLAPEQVERIEIMRAPVAEHSAQAIAGTINIILTEDQRKRPSQLKASISQEGGRAQTSLSLQHGDRSGNLSYTLAGSVRTGSQADDSRIARRSVDTQGLLHLQEQQQERSSQRSSGLQLSPRFAWRLDNGDSLNIQPFLIYSQSRTTGDVTLDRQIGQPAPYAQAHWRSEGTFSMLRTQANWQRRLEEGARLNGRISLGLHRQRGDTDRLEWDPSGQVVRRRQDDNSIRDSSLAGGGKYTRPLGEQHTLALGWESEFNRRNEDRSTLENGVPQLLEFGDELAAQTQRLAVFLQDEWEVHPRWSAYAGLRWEGLNTRSDHPSGTAVDHRSNVWSPSLHTVWRLPDTDKDQIRASLSRSYKAPRTADLIARPSRSNLNGATSPDRIGNPSLKPELAWGLELAYEHYLEQGGLISTNLFHRRIDNLIRRQTSLVADRWQSQPVNLAHARVWGLEFEAKAKLNEWWQAAPPVDLRLNYSRFWSAVEGITGPDNRLDEQPSQTANLGLDYRLPGLPLTLGGNFNWTPATSVQLSDTQQKRSASKRLLDLYALWKLKDGSQLRLAGGNLLQEEWDSSSRVDSGPLQQSELTRTSSAASWTVSWEMKF
ncbi:TonB-dependent receptor plug domain-containing protein [Parachitinimonas caeni]|uniref:TonB-dependent receptor n=1 Tax=Parachitinimonas caeni TaxID=3031301 RepID=A0ABT7E2N3_9NEIS|nr:TonB-dependent receptor [Parachitinimonas caeni]MDK2125588.1 TonB-dependent receptor [Parachitinimonas caeni]